MKRKTIRWKDKVLVAGPNGWTGWQYPRHNGYAMSCCDCGLVHRFDFRIDPVGPLSPAARGGKVVRRYGHVKFRLMRDNRSTASHRRHKEPTTNKTFLHHAADSLIDLYAAHPDQVGAFLRNFRKAVARKAAER